MSVGEAERQPERVPDERTVSVFFHPGGPLARDVFLSLTAHRTSDFPYFQIRAVDLEGDPIGGPFMFADPERVRQRWHEATAGAEMLPLSAFEEAVRELAR